MRRIGIALLCLLLCGCSVNESRIKSEVESVLKEIESEGAIKEINMRRTYFDYFLPKNVGHRFGDQENATFLLGEQTFYMNLDIAEIIISEYYDPLLSYQQKRYNEILKLGTAMFTKSGEMLNSSGEMRKYKVILTRVDKKEYFLFVQYGDVYFASLCPLSNVEELVYEMFKIGRSVKIDQPKILAAYSNKETIIITKEYDLFEKVFPENGVVYDVLHPNGDVNVGDEGTVEEEGVQEEEEAAEDAETEQE